MDGFDINDLSNIIFRSSAGFPVIATDRAIFYDDSTGLNINIPFLNDYLRIILNSVEEYTITATTMDINGNDLVDVSNFLFRSTTSILPPGSTDRAIWYDDAIGMLFNVQSGDTLRFGANGVTEYQFYTTAADWNGNSLINALFVESNAANPGAGGAIRLGNLEAVSWRNAANTNDNTLSSDSSDRYQFSIGGTAEYRFSSTIADFLSNAFNNAVFDVAGTGNRLTSTATALGDILKSDGTDFKRLARGTNGQVLTSTATDIAWQTPAGISTLGADVTCSVTATYCTVFTVPLTASSGNRLDVYMIGDSNTAGSAIQMRVQFDNAGNNGFCNYRTYTTSTAEVLDVLAATAATDTGETVWLAGANVPMPLDIQCGFETDASPGNALVQIQMEVASTGTIQKGSNYIKTP
jgi:hypothetical protein